LACLGSRVVVALWLALVVSKVASKAFDYTLFRAAKEILYLPLPYRDKTQGKALVDILTYRVAKAATSLLLLGLGVMAWPGLTLAMTLVCIAAWLGVTLVLVRRYRRLIAASAAS